MNTSELTEFLEKVINSSLNKSIMIWGAPGIGKSSIVSSLAKKLNLEFLDLRLSQLAPTDLRGLPVPVKSSSDEIKDYVEPLKPVKKITGSDKEISEAQLLRIQEIDELFFQ